jgi:purine-binding chemotaxis protein CheW
VLGPTRVQRVPLAAAYIAGMVSYRGEVLTTVSLRVLLGGDEVLNGSIVVLDSVGDTQLSEQFGLLVDGVDGVVDVGRELLRDNLLAVSEAYSGLCCGAFRTSVGLIVELDGGRLNPVWLAGQTREGIREGSRP